MRGFTGWDELVDEDPAGSAAEGRVGNLALQDHRLQILGLRPRPVVLEKVEHVRSLSSAQEPHQPGHVDPQAVQGSLALVPSKLDHSSLHASPLLRHLQDGQTALLPEVENWVARVARVGDVVRSPSGLFVRQYAT
jgi:hypothetical protein